MGQEVVVTVIKSREKSKPSMTLSLQQVQSVYPKGNIKKTFHSAHPSVNLSSS